MNCVFYKNSFIISEYHGGDRDCGDSCNVTIYINLPNNNIKVITDNSCYYNEINEKGYSEKLPYYYDSDIRKKVNNFKTIMLEKGKEHYDNYMAGNLQLDEYNHVVVKFYPYTKGENLETTKLQRDKEYLNFIFRN